MPDQHRARGAGDRVLVELEVDVVERASLLGGVDAPRGDVLAREARPLQGTGVGPVGEPRGGPVVARPGVGSAGSGHGRGQVGRALGRTAQKDRSGDDDEQQDGESARRDDSLGAPVRLHVAAGSGGGQELEGAALAVGNGELPSAPAVARKHEMPAVRGPRGGLAAPAALGDLPDLPAI